MRRPVGLHSTTFICILLLLLLLLPLLCTGHRHQSITGLLTHPLKNSLYRDNSAHFFQPAFPSQPTRLHQDHLLLFLQFLADSCHHIRNLTVVSTLFSKNPSSQDNSTLLDNNSFLPCCNRLLDLELLLRQLLP